MNRNKSKVTMPACSLNNQSAGTVQISKPNNSQKQTVQISKPNNSNSQKQTVQICKTIQNQNQNQHQFYTKTIQTQNQFKTNSPLYQNCTDSIQLQIPIKLNSITNANQTQFNHKYQSNSTQSNLHQFNECHR